MRKCKSIAEIEYKAYIEELKKGVSAKEACYNAWKKGAPRVFMSYEYLRRRIAHRYNHGTYDLKANRRDFVEFLDEIYDWWIERTKEMRSERYKYIVLYERMEQPARWPISVESFRTDIYQYMRGEYADKPFYSY